MELSKIRRIAIGLVGFLLTVNLILLVLAYVGSTKAAAGPSEFEAVAWVEKADVAESLKSALGSAGFQASVTETSREVKEPNGYRLVMTGSMDLLKSVEATLKFKKRKVKLLEEDSELQLEDPFTDKTKAENRAKQIAKADGVSFKVVDNFKRVKKPVQEIRVSAIPAEKVAEVEALFEGKTLEVEMNPVSGASEPSPDGQG